MIILKKTGAQELLQLFSRCVFRYEILYKSYDGVSKASRYHHEEWESAKNRQNFQNDQTVNKDFGFGLCFDYKISFILYHFCYIVSFLRCNARFFKVDAIKLQ